MKNSDGIDNCVGDCVAGDAPSGGDCRGGGNPSGSSVCVASSAHVLDFCCGRCIQAAGRAKTNNNENNPKTANARSTNHIKWAVFSKPSLPKKPLISKTACVANCLYTASWSSASSRTVAARICPSTLANTNPIGFRFLPAVFGNPFIPFGFHADVVVVFAAAFFFETGARLRI
jgi:hypothetical protein